MNRTVSRIAIVAPAAAAILGFGISAVQAAPMEITDHSEVEPNPGWNDIVDDFDNVDPEDVPDDEPTDEPVDEDSDEADSESDDESNNEGNEDADSFRLPAPAIEPVTTSTDGSASDDDAVEAIQSTATEVTPPTAAGVHVPPLAIGAVGAAIAGIVGWAAYRRQKLLR